MDAAPMRQTAARPQGSCCLNRGGGRFQLRQRGWNLGCVGPSPPLAEGVWLRVGEIPVVDTPHHRTMQATCKRDRARRRGWVAHRFLHMHVCVSARMHVQCLHVSRGACLSKHIFTKRETRPQKLRLDLVGGRHAGLPRVPASSVHNCANYPARRGTYIFAFYSPCTLHLGRSIRSFACQKCRCIAATSSR